MRRRHATRLDAPNRNFGDRLIICLSTGIIWFLAVMGIVTVDTLRGCAQVDASSLTQTTSKVFDR